MSVRYLVCSLRRFRSLIHCLGDNRIVANRFKVSRTHFLHQAQSVTSFLSALKFETKCQPVSEGTFRTHSNHGLYRRWGEMRTVSALCYSFYIELGYTFENIFGYYESTYINFQQYTNDAHKILVCVNISIRDLMAWSILHETTIPNAKLYP